jgi:peptide/nickel transport system substrate-binding protein
MRNKSRSFAHKILTIVTIFAVIAAITTSCSTSPNEPEQQTLPDPVEGGQIVFAINDLPTSWNPASTAWSGPATTVARTFFDPLVIINEQGSWSPYLGNFTSNEDSTIWEISVREDVTFHDGDPLTAESVYANIQNSITGIVLGPPLQSVISVEITGPLTLKLTLSESHANFPLLFTSQLGYIISPKTLNAYKEGKKGIRPIGTGPWKYSVEDGRRVIVTKNQNYWRKDTNGNQLPYLNQIEFLYEPDVLARRLLVENQDVDALLDNTPKQVKRWQENGYPEGFTSITDKNFSDRTYINLNTQTGPLADVRLREALALTTNRQAIADIASDGFFPVTDGPYSPSSPWYAESGWPEINKEKAKALVAQWKQESGLDPEISLIAAQGSIQVTMAQELERQWEEVGFVVNTKSYPTDKFIVELVTGQFDALIVQQFSAVDPIADESFWRAQTIGPEGSLSLNFPRFSNDVIEEGLRQSRATSDFDTRKAGYTAVWREWAKEFPYIFLYNSPQAVLAAPRVNNVGTITTPEEIKAAPFSWGATWVTETWVSE